MKKLISILTAGLLVLSLAACGNTQTDRTEESSAVSEPVLSVTPGNNEEASGESENVSE